MHVPEKKVGKSCSEKKKAQSSGQRVEQWNLFNVTDLYIFLIKKIFIYF